MRFCLSIWLIVIADRVSFQGLLRYRGGCVCFPHAYLFFMVLTSERSVLVCIAEIKALALSFLFTLAYIDFKQIKIRSDC